jgi:hypothetical protein
MLGSLSTMLLTLTTKRRGPGDPLVSPPQPKGPAWMKWAAGVWIANFLAFALTATYLGGDAINGYVREGHYFLAAHGRAFEVSPTLFLYSRWHAISVIGSFVILFPLALALKRRSLR